MDELARFAMAKTLFDAVCDLLEAEREAYLAASGTDIELLGRVRALLVRDIGDTQRFAAPIAGLLGALSGMNAFSTRHLAQILSVFVLLLALTAATGAYSQSVTATVAVGSAPVAVAINPVTNKIYVTNFSSSNVTVIDGAANSTTTVAAGTNPRAVAINSVTNMIYVTNFSSSNVTVIDPAPSTFTRHRTSVTMAGGNVTSHTNPTLTMNVSDAL